MKILEVQDTKYEHSLKVLDILRGLAAFYVMITHARWILWEGYSSGYLLHTEKYNLIEKGIMIFFSLFKYGHFAVIFFFILSGFVIHLKQAKKALISQQYEIDLKYFFKRRVLRIYPPYIFALLLTLFLDTFGKHIYLSLYTGEIPYTLNFLHLNTNFSFSLFFKNLLFLQENNSAIWGSNTVVWSLQMEWWFYIIYPLFLLVFRKSFLKMTIAVLLVAIISLALFFSYHLIIFKILIYFFLWWLGAFFAELYVRGILYNSITPLLLIIFLPIPFLFKMNDIYADMIFGIGVCGLISALLYTYKYYRGIEWPLFLITLGKFSYTLYLIHFPLFMFIAAIYMSKHQGSLPVNFYLLILGVMIALLVSYISYNFTEKPFTKPSLKKNSIHTL